MATFTQDYDPGFLNVPGFGQSATNPLAPVFYRSLGVVENLSVYQSIYGTKEIVAGEAFVLGQSRFAGSGFDVKPPGTFEDTVTFQVPIVVEGVSFRPTLISYRGESHLVLAAY